MSNDSHYVLGLDALRFFCFSGESQVDSWRSNPAPVPVLFREQTSADEGCDYFCGVAYVFVMYVCAVEDRHWPIDEQGCFVGFCNRLAVCMNDETAAKWSAAAVLGAENWERLRIDARKACNELGVSLPDKPPQFDISALINADEFTTSDEERVRNDSHYVLGLDALRFFCFSGESQVDSWRSNPAPAPPVLFREQTSADEGCDYFCGVGCVFVTYVSAVANRHWPIDDQGCFVDFRHRLAVYMNDETAAEWSAAAVLSAENWERLRIDARKACNELGVSLPDKPPQFDISALINADEFTTSDEERW